MKKFLLALTMMLCILLTFSVAFADEMLDACPDCGNTDLGWFPLSTSDGKDVHWQFCSSCYARVGSFQGVCTPIEGSATCISPATCQVCKFSMTTSLSPDPNAHSWTTPLYQWNVLSSSSKDELPPVSCTALRYCKNDCGTTQSETVNASAAITTPSTCNKKGVITYTASFEASWAETQVNSSLVAAPLSDHTVVTDEAVEPTCTKTGLTEGTHCDVCGLVLIGQNIVPELGHRYKTETTAPTCTEEGCITRTCTVCGDSYIRETLPATLHWFNLWTPNEDDTHSAPCRLCTHIGTAACAALEVTCDETILTVCPVCGEFGEAAFEVIEGAVMTSATKIKLPTGEAIIRGMEAPFEDVLYAFTAAYEYSGEVIPFGTTVSVSLPLSAEQFSSFELLRVDVTPATEETERTEVRSPVEFTFENDVLTFEADAAAVYLIVSAPLQ